MTAVPSMAEVLCRASHATRWEFPTGTTSYPCETCETGTQALAAAGFGHVASVEAERDFAIRTANVSADFRVAAAEDRLAAVRALADRGITGWDLTPTVSGNEDAAWWYAYLRALDNVWRSRLRAALDGEGGR